METGSFPPPQTSPVTFTYDLPERITNWKPLVQWLLAIPHWLIVWVLGQVANVVAVISWFAIVFTGRMPQGLANFECMYVRYYLRTLSYAGFLREEYPPFGFTTSPADPGDDRRVRLDFLPELENRNRLTVGFRIILAIPQLIFVAALSIAAWVVVIIAVFAVLFTGQWPAGMRDFVLKVARCWLRLETYVMLLTDQYPPFSLG